MTTNHKQGFGARLRQYRDAKGLSREDLARLIAAGGGENVRAMQIYRWENDLAEPSRFVETVKRLAAILGCAPGELMPDDWQAGGTAGDNSPTQLLRADAKATLEEIDRGIFMLFESVYEMPDNAMAPAYRKGDYLALGRPLRGAQIETLVGSDVVVEIKGKGRFCRRLVGVDASGMTLATYTMESPIMKEKAALWAAPVVGRRMK